MPTFLYAIHLFKIHCAAFTQLPVLPLWMRGGELRLHEYGVVVIFAVVGVGPVGEGVGAGVGEGVGAGAGAGVGVGAGVGEGVGAGAGAGAGVGGGLGAGAGCTLGFVFGVCVNNGATGESSEGALIMSRLSC